MPQYKGLSKCLEQKYNNSYPLAYANICLIQNEQRNSRDENELLADVWSLEHLKCYPFG